MNYLSLVLILLFTISLIIFVLEKWSPIPIHILPPLPSPVKPSPSPILRNSPSATRTPSFSPSPTPYFGPRPETIIVSGPQENAYLTDQIRVTFRFGALWPDLKEIVYETKLTPLDKDWQTTENNFRAYDLLAGDHTYLFEVRAKTKEGIVDLTPSQRRFRAVLSPYLNKIKIVSVKKPANDQEIMKITLYNDSGSKVNLTGWQIVNSLGVSFVLPKVVETYEQGKPNYLSDLLLNDGDYLILIGKESPLGVDFRLNRCFGYLTYLFNFPFSFSKNCPRPEPEEISSLSPNCQNFLLSLSACEIPSATKINQLDPLCQSYIYNQLNYSSCLNTYRYDRDFYEREWYIFVGRNLFQINNISLESGWVKLLDQNGQLVSFYQF